MLLRRQVSEELDEHIDMTPMVDVVFQLMTFMLFSLQISGSEAVEVPPSHHGIGVDEKTATIITLVKPFSPGAEPRMLMGNGEGPVVGIEEAKRVVGASGKFKVILQADGAVPHGEVLKVIGALDQVEGVTIHIGVQTPD